MQLEILGSALAIIGSLISIAGAIVNNVYLDHTFAMKCWRVSNWMLFVWAMGYIASLWDGGISGIALAAMYFIFVVTNEYGLMLKLKIYL